MRTLRRFLSDERGDVVDNVLIILVLVMVVLAVYPPIGKRIATAGAKIISIIDQITNTTYP